MQMSSQGPAKQRKLNDIYLGNIHSACLRGQYEVVLQLLRAGVDVNEEDFMEGHHCGLRAIMAI